MLKSDTLTHDGVIYIQLAEEETREAMYLLLLRVNMPVILVSVPLGSGPGLPGLSAQGCKVPFHQRVMAVLTAEFRLFSHRVAAFNQLLKTPSPLPQGSKANACPLV